MTFYVGQKVVCVDDTNDTDRWWPLTRGSVYTIASVNQVSYETRRWPVGERVVLRLAEIGNPLGKDGRGNQTDAYDSRRFRSAVSPKTSIKVFEEIRDRAVKGEPVDA